MTRLQEEAKIARRAKILKVMHAIPLLVMGSAITFFALWFLNLLQIERNYDALLKKYQVLEASQNVMVWQMDESCAQQIQTSENVNIKLIK